MLIMVLQMYIFHVEGDLIFCSIEQLNVDGKILSNGIKNDAT